MSLSCVELMHLTTLTRGVFTIRRWRHLTYVLLVIVVVGFAGSEACWRRRLPSRDSSSGSTRVSDDGHRGGSDNYQTFIQIMFCEMMTQYDKQSH